ncbi:MAG: 1-acyl-sn-glycerol-3-phosphate acyltransferase [Nitrospirae bacterium]|nr:1-acyl-sn-glycerol-3-phosphate acyltransferase [Nitrospirota bacterium]
MVFSMIGIPILTVFVVLISLFVSKRFVMKRFRRAISWYGKGMTLIPFPFIKIKYEEQKKENPHEPYIFVCNHRAASDAFLMSVLPHEAVQVVNLWPFRIPVLGFFARSAGYLNIRRLSHELFLEKAAKLLEEKVSIIFFPEGTRSGDREIGNFHGAAFRLALHSKAAIAPLCISGNENMPPRGSWLMRPGTIRIRKLASIQWKDYKDMHVFALKNKVREIISNELALIEQ